MPIIELKNDAITPSLNECRAALEKYGVPPADLIVRYVHYLMDENSRINLTGAKTADEFVLKHVADAWRAIDAIGTLPGMLFDVGSGGGLPGIPLAIFRPNSEIVLVERREKKAASLDRLVSKLGLEGRVRVQCRSFEMLPSFPKDAEYWFRGFLPGPKLAVYFSQAFPTGKLPPVVLMKGPNWATEKVEILSTPRVRSVWLERFSESQEIDYELPGGAGIRKLVLV